MSIYKRFEESDIASSIIKDIELAKQSRVSDVDKPYTLIEWLVNTSETFGTPDAFLLDHKKYVKSWYNTKYGNQVSQASQDNHYVRLLREVLLVYTTAEEARFLKNVDWNNEYEREIAVPFYAKRLRDVVLFIANQRDRIKLQKVRNSFTGSYTGVKRLIYDQIIDLLGSEYYYVMFPNRPSIDDVVVNLNVSISEYYDQTQTYHNVSSVIGQTEDRLSVTNISNVLGVNFDEVVLETIANFNEPLTSQGNTLLNETGAEIIPSKTPVISDVVKLPAEYFESYINDYADLNLHNELRWAEKYYGVDQYVLSTDYSLHKSIASKFPEANHLNITYPSVAISVNSANLIKESRVGEYFKRTGISHYYSLDNRYIIVKGVDITSNVIIPDPLIYSTDTQYIKYSQDVRWMKADLANDSLFGDLIDVSTYQKLYGYQSASETNKYQKVGISRVTDKVDFWEGTFDDVWSNSDIYSVVLPYDYEQVTKQRTEDLLLGENRAVKWRTDVYGNEFVLMKPIETHRFIQPQEVEPPARCYLLDGNVFWDDMTFIYPDFGYHYDGGVFLGQALSAYKSFAVAGNMYIPTCELQEMD